MQQRAAQLAALLWQAGMAGGLRLYASWDSINRPTVNRVHGRMKRAQ